MNDNPPQISFVVPCYNESLNLADTVTELAIAAREVNLSRYEIVVVDDCSTDNTLVVAQRLAAENPNILIVSNPVNLGYGGAYKNGVKHAHGTYAITIPGDNAHPANGISPILRKAGETDIVIPYVINPEARSHMRRLISRTFTAIFNGLFGLRVPYYNGLVLYRTNLLRSIEIKTDGFAFQAEAITRLLTAGASYSIVGVEIAEHKHGGTTAFRLKNVYRVLETILSLFFELRVARWLGLRRLKLGHRPRTND